MHTAIPKSYHDKESYHYPEGSLMSLPCQSLPPSPRNNHYTDFVPPQISFAYSKTSWMELYNVYVLLCKRPLSFTMFLKCILLHVWVIVSFYFFFFLLNMYSLCEYATPFQIALFLLAVETWFLLSLIYLPI